LPGPELRLELVVSLLHIINKFFKFDNLPGFKQILQKFLENDLVWADKENIDNFYC